MKRNWIRLASLVVLLGTALSYAGATTILKGDQLQGKPNITIVNGGGTLTLPSTTGTICHKGEACSYTANGAASTPAMSLTGSLYSGGTSTTTKPLLLLEPTGATSTGWSTSGTMLGINADSGFLGHLISGFKNGVQQFYVTYGGAVSATSYTATSATIDTLNNKSGNNTTLSIGTARTYSSANTTQVKLANQTDSSSSGTGTAVAITPTWNQTSTAGGTDLLINRTETAIGSGSHKLIDAQVGGASKFSVERTGAISVAEQSTPSTPPSGYVSIYPKSDGKYYKLDDTGAESQLGSGGGGLYEGGQNTLSNNSWESHSSGWTASGGTYTRTTTAANIIPPGVGAGSWDSDAAGQTLTADAVTITSGDGLSGRNGAASCSFKAASGTATHKIQAYDGTNVLAESSITSSTSGFVRTSVNFPFPASGTIALRVISVAADEPTVYVDDCYLGLAEGFNLGVVNPVTDWTSFTPTGSWSSNTTYTGKWRQVGDTMEIQYNLALAGAPTAANLTLNLPSGYSIDTSKLGNSTAQIQVVGQGSAQDNGTALFPVWVRYASSSTLDVVYADDTGSVAFIAIVSSTAPFTFGNTDTVTVTAKVPISGWTSEQAYRQDQVNVWGAKKWFGTSTSIKVGASAAASSTRTTLSHANLATYTRFGSAADDSSSNAQLTLTLPAGDYIASYSGFMRASTAASGTPTNCVFEIHDGSTAVASQVVGSNTQSGQDVNDISYFHAPFTVSSQASKTFTLRAAKVTGDSGANSYCEAYLDSSQTAGVLMVYPAGMNIPVPLLVGSVTSNSRGQERVERASLTATPTISSQSGSWLSSPVNNGTGDKSFTIVSGIFSATPSCTCTINSGGGGDVGCQIHTVSSTSIRLIQKQNAAVADLNFDLICMGPR